MSNVDDRWYAEYHGKWLSGWDEEKSRSREDWDNEFNRLKIGEELVCLKDILPDGCDRMIKAGEIFKFAGHRAERDYYTDSIGRKRVNKLWRNQTIIVDCKRIKIHSKYWELSHRLVTAKLMAE